MPGKRNNESFPQTAALNPYPFQEIPSLPGDPPVRPAPGGQGVRAAPAQVCPYQAHQKAQPEDKSSAAGRVLTLVP